MRMLTIDKTNAADVINAQIAVPCTGCSYYEILAGKFGKAKECIECGQCEGVCPQHLPIIEKLKEVSGHFDA